MTNFTSPRIVGRSKRGVLAACLVGAAALGLTSYATAPDESDAANVDLARATLEKWIETQRLISQEKKDWALGKETLGQRIELVEREIEALRSRIGDAEKGIAEADQRRMELIEKNDKLKAASAVLEGAARGLEERTAGLLAGLPEPIRDRVRPLSQRLPKGDAETTLSIADRFQNLVGILNEVDKFNRALTVVSEVRTFEDGATAEVDTLYVGIGQGFYVNPGGTTGGVGSGGPEGWSWSPADAAALQITEAIRVLRNERLADFIQLPVRILP